MHVAPAALSDPHGSITAKDVSLRFRYTEAEYVAAVRQYFDPFPAKFMGAFGALLLALGVFAGFVGGDSYAQWFMISIGMLALALFYRNYYAAPRRWYRQSPQHREEYSLHYSDTGIVFRTKDIDSTLQWNLYLAVRETEQFYFLIYGKNAFSIIPKRAFNSVEQEQTFRELLRRHIDPQLPPAQQSADEPLRVEEYVPNSLEPPDWR